MAECRTQTMQPRRERECDSLRSFSLAMAYVPWQHWETTCDLEKALRIGTIFPELNKPFLGRRGGCR